MSSSLNLKVRVKNGELSPAQALELLLDKAEDREEAAESRTARWLSSPNAKKRYNQALKAAKKQS